MTCQTCNEPIPPGEQWNLGWEFSEYDLHADRVTCLERLIETSKTETETAPETTEGAAQ